MGDPLIETHAGRQRFATHDARKMADIFETEALLGESLLRHSFHRSTPQPLSDMQFAPKECREVQVTLAVGLAMQG